MTSLRQADVVRKYAYRRIAPGLVVLPTNDLDGFYVIGKYMERADLGTRSGTARLHGVGLGTHQRGAVPEDRQHARSRGRRVRAARVRPRQHMAATQDDERRHRGRAAPEGRSLMSSPSDGGIPQYEWDAAREWIKTALRNGVSVGALHDVVDSVARSALSEALRAERNERHRADIAIGERDEAQRKLAEVYEAVEAIPTEVAP